MIALAIVLALLAAGAAAALVAVVLRARDRAEHRVAQLEAQLDELRARALGVPMPAPYVAPRPLAQVMGGVRRTEEVELPDEVLAELGAIEDDEARAEFAELARERKRQRPDLDARTLAAEVFG